MMCYASTANTLTRSFDRGRNMRVALITLVGIAVFGTALASAVPPQQWNHGVGKIADKEFLERQKNILRLLMHVHQPNSYKDQVQIAKSWRIEANIAEYSNATAVKDFIVQYRYGLLPRGEVFSIMDEVQRRQVVSVFNIMYYAKNYEIFYKTACWAREYINEGMFVYALTVTVLHRDYLRGMVLPAPYEIYPYYFLSEEVIQKAQQYKLQDFAYYKSEHHKTVRDGKSNYKKQYHSDDEVYHYMPVNNQNSIMVAGKSRDEPKVYIIPANYTGWYLNVDEDQQLSYFTEDIGLNAYYFYFHADYPFWMEGENYGLNKDRRGELNLFFHQQMVARYELERYSNGLSPVKMIDLHRHMQTSYIPSLRYANGLEFPYRPAHTDIVYDDYTLMIQKRMQSLEERIFKAIDSGYIETDEGKRIDLYNENGINVLGNLIEGNPDSPNKRFYGYIQVYAKLLLGFAKKPTGHYRLHPSVLEQYETAMRDPIFYSIYKKILSYYYSFKRNMPKYTNAELAYPGVKISSVTVDQLFTYFDHFDIDLNNAIYTDFTKESEVPSYLVKARQMRLNHKAFSYKVSVASDKAAQVAVRIFLGPKYNEKGNYIDLNEDRDKFVELDKFMYELKAGRNDIERNSRQFYGTVQDRTSYYTLYRKVMAALQDKEKFVLDQSEAHCGFPNRLILPKGRIGGATFQLFVYISPYHGAEGGAQDEDVYTCGVGSGHRDFDNQPYGYPLDRKIDEPSFYQPNMYFQDVVIYHKRREEINLKQA